VYVVGTFASHWRVYLRPTRSLSPHPVACTDYGFTGVPVPPMLRQVAFSFMGPRSPVVSIVRLVLTLPIHLLISYELTTRGVNPFHECAVSRPAFGMVDKWCPPNDPGDLPEFSVFLALSGNHYTRFSPKRNRRGSRLFVAAKNRRLSLTV